MSRSADDSRGSAYDSGFSLIEVIVSIGILMIVTVALLPQLVLGIQATGTARTVTQAKGVAQGQLEKMRNLPYYISPEAGDFRDVLDTYYRNRSVPHTSPGCTTGSGRYAMPQPGAPGVSGSWTGFVPAATARCDYEPAGAFYRRVIQGPVSPGSPTPVIVVDTRFMSGVTPGETVPPSSAYDSQTLAGSQPTSTQIGVTVAVVYIERGKVKVTSTSTQISDRPVTVERIRAESNVTAVEVGSETTANGPASLSAGVLHLGGSLSYASTVNASLAGTSASLATGEQSGGATATVAAPPSITKGVVNEGQGSLTSSGCDTACWGTTRLDVPEVRSTDGLPQAGSVAAPLQSLVTDKTTNGGFSFGNSTSSEYRPGLSLVPPLVRLDSGATATSSGTASGCTAGGGTLMSYVTAGGYLSSTSDTTPTVESCAVARASSVSLFPTAFAPQGVVQVELTQARAQCTVAGTAHTPTVSAGYSAEVRYWNGTVYETLPIAQGMANDPLDAVPLATTSVGGGLFLGDFVGSWSALRASEVVSKATGGVAELKLPGIVTVTSRPTRNGATATLDPKSVVSVAVGALSCAAEDQR